MKLDKDFNIVILIFLICLYHGTLQNGLEKMFSEIYFNYEEVKRPLPKCSNCLNGQILGCIGMPSGHAETITILSLLLYLYNFIPLWLCLILIIVVSGQRITSQMHTLSQVVAGISFGYMYALLYRHFNAIIQNRTFISWKQLEKYLDTIVERIRHSGENFDAVVGIKTGGAFISDYISQKLDIPNYKVKLSLSEYKCNKQPSNVVDDIVKKMILNDYGKFTVCEGIDESLEGKNIILIDELVASGRTMTETYKYLKNEKHVGNIYATSVALYKRAYKGDINIDYVLPKTVLIWPWGYDN